MHVAGKNEICVSNRHQTGFSRTENPKISSLFKQYHMWFRPIKACPGAGDEALLLCDIERYARMHIVKVLLERCVTPRMNPLVSE